MSNQDWLKLLQQQRAIAVIRVSERSLGRQMADAVASGGIKLIEITWNSDGAAELISTLRSELPMCTIGSGTLLTLADMQQALAAGAQFLFTPHLDRAMIEKAVSLNVPIVPGALSPTEIVTAHQAGASCVKVFPIEAVGGANYIKNLQGPLGNIPLIPTGGVTLANAEEFLTAGAIAIGLSGSLFPRNLVLEKNWSAISHLARQLCKVIHQNSHPSL